MSQFALRRSAVMLATLAAACATVASFAQPEPSHKSAPTADPSRAEGPASAEKTMEAIEDHMDTLTKQLGKPEALQTIWEIERLALRAKSLTPEHLKGGATPENLTGYRKAQVELMALLLKVETDILDNNTADAQKVLDQIDELRKESHKKFKARKKD